MVSKPECMFCDVAVDIFHLAATVLHLSLIIRSEFVRPVSTVVLLATKLVDLHIHVSMLLPHFFVFSSLTC